MPPSTKSFKKPLVVTSLSWWGQMPDQQTGVLFLQPDKLGRALGTFCYVNACTRLCVGTLTHLIVPLAGVENPSSGDPRCRHIPVPHDETQTLVPEKEGESEWARRCIWCVGCRLATPVLTPQVPESHPDLSFPAAFAIQVEKSGKKADCRRCTVSF